MGSLGVMHPEAMLLKRSAGQPYCSCGASSATSRHGTASSTVGSSLLSPLHSYSLRRFEGRSQSMRPLLMSSLQEGRVGRELFTDSWDGLKKKLGRGSWRQKRGGGGTKAGCGSSLQRGSLIMVESQYVDFLARKTLKLPVRELAHTVDDYLQNVDRVVAVTLPDSRRIQYIGNSTWRARLKPVEFFSVTATPICDMRAWYEDKTLRIFSDSLKLDFSDAGRSAEEFKLRLSLNGQLRAVRQRAPSPPLTAAARAASSTTTTTTTQSPGGSFSAPGPARSSMTGGVRNVANEPQYGKGLWEHGNGGVAVSSKSPTGVSLEGAVTLKLSLNLPLPLSLLPEPVVKAVGDNILERILSNLQASLLKGLLDDYAKWCGEKAKVAYPEAGRG